MLSLYGMLEYQKFVAVEHGTYCGMWKAVK